MNCADHFLKPSEGMDEQLSFLAEVEVNVHLSHSSEPSESISVHGSVSAKGAVCVGICIH